MAQPYRPPRRLFPAHFVLLIAARSTFGVLLRPLFGQFQKVNSPKLTRLCESRLVEDYLSFVSWERTWRSEEHTATDAESPPRV